VITILPLADTFSDACFEFQSVVPPAPAPDGIGAGSLLWNDLGPLATSASTSLDVILTVTGECNPALNTADVSFAVDENGDSVPPAQDSAGLQTIGAKIGDRIWNDRDGDGVQDAGEGGIAGVIVYVDLNNDDSRDAGEPFDTTDVTGACLRHHRPGSRVLYGSGGCRHPAGRRGADRRQQPAGGDRSCR
jgi:hypothetical protein